MNAYEFMVFIHSSTDLNITVNHPNILYFFISGRWPSRLKHFVLNNNTDKRGTLVVIDGLF